MGEILLLHGAWHGGWCWRDVASQLDSDGHVVHTPSYIGMGERAAELAPGVGLVEHVAEIEAWLGERRDLVVCGHSYGGAVMRILEDRKPQAFKAALYLDGAIPEPGQSILDLNDAKTRERRLAIAASEGQGWRLPVPDPAELWPGLSDEQATWLRQCMTDQPLKAFTDPQPESAQWAQCRHLFVYASDRQPQPYRRSIDLFEAKGWQTVGLVGGHELMVTRPKEVAAMLDALANDAKVQSSWD